MAKCQWHWCAKAKGLVWWWWGGLRSVRGVGVEVGVGGWIKEVKEVVVGACGPNIWWRLCATGRGQGCGQRVGWGLAGGWTEPRSWLTRTKGADRTEHTTIRRWPNRCNPTTVPTCHVVRARTHHVSPHATGQFPRFWFTFEQRLPANSNFSLDRVRRTRAKGQGGRATECHTNGTRRERIDRARAGTARGIQSDNVSAPADHATWSQMERGPLSSAFHGTRCLDDVGPARCHCACHSCYLSATHKSPIRSTAQPKESPRRSSLYAAPYKPERRFFVSATLEPAAHLDASAICMGAPCRPWHAL